MNPDDYWNSEPAYQKQYDGFVDMGRAMAADAKLCVLSIARNAMPHLTNTLSLLEQAVAPFKQAVFYAYENDSTDGTGEELVRFAETRPWVAVERASLGRPDLRSFEEDRTVALAEYRNRCRLWAKANAPDFDYYAVLDTDPHGGFSPAGLLNSVGWLGHYASDSRKNPAGMASISLWSGIGDEGELRLAHYDAWAARLNYWDDRRDHRWFHLWLPPVGSTPVPFHSAFGGLAVYRNCAFLAPGVEYVGGDCEHVALHKSMSAAGYQMYLNPGCRYAAVIPDAVTA
jgi:hypothetical protein